LAYEVGAGEPNPVRVREPGDAMAGRGMQHVSRPRRGARHPDSAPASGSSTFVDLAGVPSFKAHSKVNQSGTSHRHHGLAKAGDAGPREIL